MKITTYRGNTHLVQMTVTFTDPANNTTGPMDLTSATAKLFVKKSDSGVPLLTIDGQIYGPATNGVLRFPITPGMTDELGGSYRYCVDITRPSLDVYTVARDTIEILSH